MYARSRRRRLLSQIAGVALLMGGAVGCFHWWYRGPARRLRDPDWLLNHSDRARWAEEQKNYRRTGAQPSILGGEPDLIGYYGDKEWLLWLDERATSGEPFRVCGCTRVVLSLMSNHDLDIKDLGRGGWFEAHRSQTQEEWIRDGFREYGLSVHLPPTDEDTIPLLELLGRRFDEASPTPHYVQYNAFRWLRDGGGLRLEKYVLLEKRFSMLSAEARLGLALYKGLELQFPPWEGLGLLSFAEPWDMSGELPGRSAWDRYVLPMLCLALLGAGTLLVTLPFLSKRASAG